MRLIKASSFQLNIFLGVFTLTGYHFQGSMDVNHMGLILTGIAGLALYIAECWAFLYKLTIVRAEYLYGLSGGNADKRVGKTVNQGCMLFYAFLMRFVFRIILAMSCFFAFDGSLEEDPSTWMIIAMIVIVLFEVFVMLFSMYETHIFRDEEEEENENYWEGELKWRKKVFPKLMDEKKNLKLFFANSVLYLTAGIFTLFFWNNSNAEFVTFIQVSAKQNESVFFVLFSILLANIVLCLILLMPVRLAFWIEDKMNAENNGKIWKYRLSLVFAGASITYPVWKQLFLTYMIN